MKSTSTKRGARAEPAEDTKTRLLLAAIEVFGRHGFEAASTRMLAEAAGVNLQSIPYYFESKEGLYLAVAHYIVERIQDRVHPLIELVYERLAARAEGPRRKVPKEDARELLQEVLTSMARLFLHNESEPWARFMIREQMDPTAAFDIVYARVLSPMLELLRVLLGHALGKDPNSEQVRLRAMSTMGQVLVLRAGRATLMRQLAWKKIGADELAAADALVANLVLAIVPAPPVGGARVRGRA
ncbi:MAG: TetR family transcriptional regulator protein [Myxococcaceae bacterium]|nr:TetR family transcriptional regulator protein [Myxococcaceae bacterium]